MEGVPGLGSRVRGVVPEILLRLAWVQGED